MLLVLAINPGKDNVAEVARMGADIIVTGSCNDPSKPAQVMPLTRMPQRVSSCPTPGGAVGCCRS
jgi:hypothetical protein